MKPSCGISNGCVTSKIALELFKAMSLHSNTMDSLFVRTRLKETIA